MSAKHIHEFKEGKSKKVAICSCGKFQHINLKQEDVIAGIEKTKHTPGPWKRGHSDNQVIYSDYKQIAVIQCREKEWESNARLIAAAPEMYLAILAMLKCAKNGDILKGAEVLNLMEEAIAKAEGKS